MEAHRLSIHGHLHCTADSPRSPPDSVSLSGLRHPSLISVTYRRLVLNRMPSKGLTVNTMRAVKSVPNRLASPFDSIQKGVFLVTKVKMIAC